MLHGEPQSNTEVHRDLFHKLCATLCFFVQFCVASFSFSASGYAQSPKDTISIGLLIQDRNSKAAMYGAELAIREANKAETKKYFTLAVRDMEGPWGTGSKVAVDLVFNEKVWAIIASVDGRNSHLAEQVSAKTRIPFLSAWSGDPSLSYAFIPWYYSCVPNDQQKAVSVLDHLNLKGSSSIAIISAKDYDSKTAAATFLKAAEQRAIRAILIHYEKTSSFDSISSAIKKARTGTIAFFGPQGDLYKLRKNNFDSSFRFLFVSTPDAEASADKDLLEGVTLISPGYLFTTKGRKFAEAFHSTFSRYPVNASAYAYDMTNVLINALKRPVEERDSLRNYLRNTMYEGITGNISFDERGNRNGVVELMTVRKGEFVRSEE